MEEEEVKEDIRKKYRSLPPNYVSLAQLQERWMQQKQKQLEQKEQVASENQQQQQSKEKNRFNGGPRSSKNFRQNGELRADVNKVPFHRRQSDGNPGRIWKNKSQWKSEKLESRASGDTKNTDYNQMNRGPRVKEGLNGEDLGQTLPESGAMSGVLIGKNGGKEGFPGYENKRVHEIASVCMVGLASEIRGKEVNREVFSRQPRGKQVVDDQFPNNSRKQVADDEASNCTNTWRVEAKSRGKQVVDDQFLNSSDSCRIDAKPRGKQVVDDQPCYNTDGRRVEAKSRGKQVVDDQPFYSTDSQRVEAKSLGKQVVDDQFSDSSDSQTVEAKSRGKQMVNGHFYCSTGDQMVESQCHGKEAVNGQFSSNTGSMNEYMAEVQPENESEVSMGLRRKSGRRYNTKYGRYKRSGNDKGPLEAGNVGMLDTEVEEEVSSVERRKTGKERFGSSFQGNESKRRMNRNSNENEVQLELGQQQVEEGVFMGKNERTGPEARTGKGARGYGNKDRGYHWIGRDFRNLSLGDSRRGNSSRGHWQSYGNYGISTYRKGKQIDSGLVWVKKEEISDTNAAEIS